MSIFLALLSVHLSDSECDFISIKNKGDDLLQYKMGGQGKKPNF